MVSAHTVLSEDPSSELPGVPAPGDPPGLFQPIGACTYGIYSHTVHIHIFKLLSLLEERGLYFGLMVLKG